MSARWTKEKRQEIPFQSHRNRVRACPQYSRSSRALIQKPCMICHSSGTAQQYTKSTFNEIAQCFLDTCGIDNKREIEIIVDILTNPSSIYIDRKFANKHKRMQIRNLNVELHLLPVLERLTGKLGCTKSDLRKIVLKYPLVL